MSKKSSRRKRSGSSSAAPAVPHSEIAARGHITVNGAVSPKESLSQLKTTEVTISGFYVSVPPPGLVEAYLPYYPDAPKKFFEWAEAESAHRRKMDEKLINSQIRDSLVGLIFGLIISLAALGFAAFAAWLDHPWVAGIIGGGTLVSLVQTFIYGRRFIHKRHGKKDVPDTKKDS